MSIGSAYFYQIPFCDAKTVFGKCFFEFQKSVVFWVEFRDWEGVVWGSCGGTGNVAVVERAALTSRAAVDIMGLPP